MSLRTVSRGRTLAGGVVVVVVVAEGILIELVVRIGLGV